MWRVIIRPRAEANLQEARQWYEKQRMGLGNDFTRTVRDAIRRLPENPLIYRLRHRRLGIRRFYPPRFPYRIVYRIQGESILVFAVLHAKQHDRHWRKRARES
ncbi:MAG: type II toxin-antitoxin system RelE/ParE family toxin [Pedosphaera sp.]|nr:type II toxin-antitoxin system RelE/ParE family toxin [Pedosphaera sp.]